LLIAISRAFTIPPRRAAGLFTDGSKYLAGILIKGIANEFAPAESFLMQLHSVSDHFTNLIQKEESGTIEMVLNTLKAGFYSKEQKITKLTLTVMEKMASNLVNTELQKNLWDWFTEEEGGLAGIAHSLKKHSEIEKAVIEVLLKFAGDRSFEVFTQLLKFAMNDDIQYWKIVNSFIAPFASLDITDKRSFDLIFSSWLESAVRISENKNKQTVSDKSIMISIMCEILISNPKVIEVKEELAEKTLIILRRTMRNSSKAIQLYALAQIFKLLEVFAARKNSYAASIYKSIALAFVELHGQEEIREFILNNLKKVYATIQSIPISVIIDVMIQVLQNTENTTYFFNCFDFEFLRRVITHPKLDLKTAVHFLDLFAKYILNDSIYSMISLRYFRIVCNRMRQEATVLQLLSKCANIIFNSLPTAFKRYFHTEPKLSNNEKTLLDFNLKKFIKVLLVIQSMKNERMNSQMRGIVIKLCLNIKNEFGEAYEPLKALLKIYGEPEELIDAEIERIREEERKVIEEKEEPKKELALVPIEEEETQVVAYQKRVNLGKKAKAELELIKKHREEREAKVNPLTLIR